MEKSFQGESTGFSAPFAECDGVTQARRTAQRLARTDLPVIIAGETGTGRSTLAAAVAELRGPGIRNVARISGLEGLPDHLPASALLVNELDALGPADQRRLAQAITGQASVVGTLRDGASLEPSLANTLSTGIVHMPAMRERGADIGSWFTMFLEDAARAHGVEPPALSETAATAIRLHAWPGNLHELKQRAERAVALMEGSSILPEHLGLVAGELQSAIMPLEEAMADFKRRYVQQVLDRCGGNRTQAARMLKVDPRTIFRFLEAARR